MSRLPVPRRAAKHALAGLAVTLLGTLAFSAAPAAAAACDPNTGQASCDIDGTLTLTGGNLSIAAPATLGWATTLNGLDQDLVDPTAGHQTYVVNDATGTADGWHITAQAGAFTCTTAATCDTDALPATAFRTNGSLSDIGSTTAPSVACSTNATGCTPATTNTSYPVTIGSTATTIFNATANTGMGSNTVSDVGWWLHVPADTRAGTYESTVTVAAVSGP